MTMHRVRIAGDIKFYPETGGKKAVAYVSLVEDRQQRQADGSYVDADPKWYDGSFRGGWAEELHENYRAGDNLLVDADLEKHSFQKEGGETVRSTKMYVTAFGPDAIRSHVSIDRTPRPSQSRSRDRTQERTVETAQSNVDQEGEPSAKAFDSGWAEAELHRRLGELINAERCSVDDATAIMDAYRSTKDNPEAAHSAASYQAKARLQSTERIWLGSVTEAPVTQVEPLSWQDAESRVVPPSHTPRTEPAQAQSMAPAM